MKRLAGLALKVKENRPEREGQLKSRNQISKPTERKGSIYGIFSFALF